MPSCAVPLEEARAGCRRAAGRTAPGRCRRPATSSSRAPSAARSGSRPSAARRRPTKALLTTIASLVARAQPLPSRISGASIRVSGGQADDRETVRGDRAPSASAVRRPPPPPWPPGRSSRRWSRPGRARDRRFRDDPALDGPDPRRGARRASRSPRAGVIAVSVDGKVELLRREQPVERVDQRRADVSADMKKTPPAASVATVETSRPRRRKPLRMERSSGRATPPIPASARSNAGRSELRLRDAEVRERLAHRNPARFPHRPRRREHRDEQADRERQEEDPGRHREARDVEVQEHRHRAAERAAAEKPRRHRQHEGPRPRGRALCPGRSARSGRAFRRPPSSRRSGGPATP